MKQTEDAGFCQIGETHSAKGLHQSYQSMAPSESKGMQCRILMATCFTSNKLCCSCNLCGDLRKSPFVLQLVLRILLLASFYVLQTRMHREHIFQLGLKATLRQMAGLHSLMKAEDKSKGILQCSSQKRQPHAASAQLQG